MAEKEYYLAMDSEQRVLCHHTDGQHVESPALAELAQQLLSL